MPDNISDHKPEAEKEAKEGPQPSPKPEVEGATVEQGDQK